MNAYRRLSEHLERQRPYSGYQLMTAEPLNAAHLRGSGALAHFAWTERSIPAAATSDPERARRNLARRTLVTAGSLTVMVLTDPSTEITAAQQEILSDSAAGFQSRRKDLAHSFSEIRGSGNVVALMAENAHPNADSLLTLIQAAPAVAFEGNSYLLLHCGNGSERVAQALLDRGACQVIVPARPINGATAADLMRSLDRVIQEHPQGEFLDRLLHEALHKIKQVPEAKERHDRKLLELFYNFVDASPTCAPPLA